MEKQLQRVGGRLLHRETKTEESDAPLPLPGICVTALRLRRVRQDAAPKSAGSAWHATNLIFTTRYGRPVEPRNFLPLMGGAVRSGQRAKDQRS